MQVVAVAYEARIGANAHHDERIAAVSALEAGVPLAANPDPLAVVDPCGHVDLERALDDSATFAVAVTARRIEHATEAPALGAGLLVDELPEHVLGDPPHEPDAAAGRALVRAGARLGSGRRAALARDGDFDRNRGRETRERLLEVDLDDHLQIRAASRSMAPRRSPAEEILSEERGEDIREVAEMREARLEASPSQARVSEAVVQSRGARGR